MMIADMASVSLGYPVSTNLRTWVDVISSKQLEKEEFKQWNERHSWSELLNRDALCVSP